jgi:hypothetical protein
LQHVGLGCITPCCQHGEFPTNSPPSTHISAQHPQHHVPRRPSEMHCYLDLLPLSCPLLFFLPSFLPHLSRENPRHWVHVPWHPSEINCRPPPTPPTSFLLSHLTTNLPPHPLWSHLLTFRGKTPGIGYMYPRGSGAEEEGEGLGSPSPFSAAE